MKKVIRILNYYIMIFLNRKAVDTVYPDRGMNINILKLNFWGRLSLRILAYYFKPL